MAAIAARISKENPGSFIPAICPASFSSSVRQGKDVVVVLCLHPDNDVGLRQVERLHSRPVAEELLSLVLSLSLSLSVLLAAHVTGLPSSTPEA